MLVNKQTINIAVVDDHPIVIEGLQKILPQAFSITDIKEFVTGISFINFLKEKLVPIDVVLLDITLPDRSGIDLCKEIKLLSPTTRILAFSNHNERSIILEMLQSGASGYLLKNVSATELITCIQEALNNEITFSQEVKEILARADVSALKQLPSLTRREKEVLKMIAEGKTSIEIAKELFVSPLTIETHRRNLMQKFDAKNVAALMKLASELKLV